ncbi:SDR family oxidoreductase [Alphaproteobacteria bacterium]|jgi:NAD(P)-dependent dehydrogenase (short-subunit alcohol dehydrogenase family)|nr:SDR family oxidoreductase [Alphaproteobacteria bacterium]MDB9871731.1 SDR family oxidoreductase [Alphaproteobacteria bacterium]MDC0134683.1 SDR family oxidoreductase [Alphaproteobacteria bacterium]|tara:strand:- start:857 stop:1639 length:783 start_codon:yes stop_codon:yes gene_type:complete
MSKKNKTACITGAGNGIGRAISIAMGNEGYNIVCADINSDHANETLDIIKKNNGLGIVIKTDVTNFLDIKKMVSNTIESFGSIDVLVNNAGVTRTSGIMDLTEEDWHWIHNVNAKGTFFCLQETARQMIKQKNGGRIINMASVGGKGFVDVSNAIYAASKGAVISLTKTAAQELGKYEITVNAICPGITHTNILSNIIKKRSLEQNKTESEIIKHYVRDIPLGRANEPEDIAAMVVFLSSEGAKNISGQSYNIDGGLIPS